MSCRTNLPRSDKTRPRHRLQKVTALTSAALLVVAAVILDQSRQGKAAPSPAHSSPRATVSLSATAPARAPQPSAPAQPAVPGSWHLVFADDFSGESPDPSRWVTCYDWNLDGCTNAGNRELEWYTPEQVTVRNGTATLTSVRKPTTGTGGKVYPWASGMLSTGRPSWNASPRFTFTYGYIEASIKMPATTSMFPAFWLLTADETVRPEVDIAEMIGSSTFVLMNLHVSTPTGTDARSPHSYGPVDFSAGYHEFAVDWEPEAITWYIDGVARYAITDRLIIPTGPMEMLFTLAVGFPNAPPADVSTASMSIEHVRVWQR
jgi:beta-glucanase (GH16 family)